MGFHFRYEALLSYRRHLKERAEVEFSRAQKQLQICREGLKEFNDKRDRVTALLESDLRKKVASYVMKNYSDYIKALGHKIAVQKLEVIQWEEVVRKKLEILLYKTKQHKVIERLKEKDLEKWKQNQNFLEQKTINEVAILRHGKEPL